MSVLERAFPGWSETPDADTVYVPAGSSWAGENDRRNFELMPDLYERPDDLGVDSPFHPYNSLWRLT